MVSRFVRSLPWALLAAVLMLGVAHGNGLVSGSATALQGYAVAATAPTSGYNLQWNGSAWAPASGSSFTGGTLTSQLNWATGLGVIVHVKGPTDQPTQVAAGGGNNAAGDIYMLNGLGDTYVVCFHSGLVDLATIGGDLSWNGSSLTPSGAQSLGSADSGFGVPFLEYTNTGTVGDVTINKASGRVNVAASGTSVTVTDSKVTAKSHVMAIVSTNDATAFVQSVVPAAGSFVIRLGAAATAQTSIDFVVIGAD